MKKIISILVVTVLLAAAFSMSAYAADTVNVTVTIWDGNGNAAVALETLSVTDTDNDNKLSVGDVLSAAHDKWYDGGATSGYKSEQTEWGISLTRLWGDDSGSYGYYVNNQMAMSLEDEVHDGDYVAAFVYVDKKELSDSYAFIEFCSDKSSSVEKCFLVQYIGWDENWNPKISPVVGATVYIDGTDSGVTTDADGYARLGIKDAGEHTVTVRSAEKNYACGVCRITVDAPETESVSVSDTGANAGPESDSPTSVQDGETTAAQDGEASAVQPNAAAQTGDAAAWVASILAIAALLSVFTQKGRAKNRR